MPQPKTSAASAASKRRTTAAKPKAAASAKKAASSAKKPATRKPAAEAATAKPAAKPAVESIKREGDPLAQLFSTLRDANDLVGDLLRRGREQTDDVLGNLDELLGRGLEQLETLSRKLEGRASQARRADSVDRLMRSADRARRAVGIGSSFPILGYDDLSAPKVAARLGDLKPPELRKVRDYETRHANRKSVLAAIDRALR